MYVFKNKIPITVHSKIMARYFFVKSSGKLGQFIGHINFESLPMHYVKKIKDCSR